MSRASWSTDATRRFKIKKPYVLDTSAIMILIENEAGADRRDSLERVGFTA